MMFYLFTLIYIYVVLFWFILRRWILPEDNGSYGLQMMVWQRLLHVNQRRWVLVSIARCPKKDSF